MRRRCAHDRREFVRPDESVFMLLWDHLEQMHGVGREQADRSERKTSKAEATCEPSERHHAGDNRPRSENDANLICC